MLCELGPGLPEPARLLLPVLSECERERERGRERERERELELERRSVSHKGAA